MVLLGHRERPEAVFCGTGEFLNTMKKKNFLALGKRIPNSNDRKYISVHKIIIESTLMKNMRNFLLSFFGHVLAFLLVNFL